MSTLQKVVRKSKLLQIPNFYFDFDKNIQICVLVFNLNFFNETTCTNFKVS